MIVRLMRMVFILAVILNFISCISTKQFNEKIQELNGEIKLLNQEIRRLDFRVYTQEQRNPTLEDIKKKKRKEKVVDTVKRHTHDPNLKNKLDEFEKNKQKKTEEIKKVSKEPDIDQKKKMLKVQQEIDNIIDKSYQSIMKMYKIEKIDFLDINNVEIPEKGKEILRNLIHEFTNICYSNETIIIYGFGCYIGPERKTIDISSSRAKNIADWITKNTKCTHTDIRHEGLGIYLRRDDVKSYVKSERQLKKILSDSRHAEIFIPKRHGER